MWLKFSGQEALFSPKSNVLLDFFQMFGRSKPNRPRYFPPCVQILMCRGRVPHTKHELKALRIRDRIAEFLIGANLKNKTQFNLLR